MSESTEWQFIPFVHRNAHDGLYRPAVKILLNGQHSSTVEFDLPFDEERFASPYSRQFADDLGDCDYSGGVGYEPIVPWRMIDHWTRHA